MKSVFFTIFTGVSVYVIGQAFVKLIIEPVHNYKKVISDIAHALIEYAEVYSNPGKFE